MTEFSTESLVLVGIMLIVPTAIAAFREPKNTPLIIFLNIFFTLAILFSSRLGFPAIPPIVALPVWIGITIWAVAAPKSKEQAPTPAVPNNPPRTTDQPRYDPNRHLPKNLEELDKLAVKIRKSLKASEKES